MVIDARNKLKPEDITHFLEKVNSTIIIEDNLPFNTILDEDVLKKDFVSKLLELSMSDNDEILCLSDDEEVELLITGLDINWWKQNARRYNKLYKAAEEAFNAIPLKTYRCGIATLIEGKLSQINIIEGTKDAVLNALNENIKHRYIDSFLKAQIVINLAYEEDDEYELEEWHTLDELREIGAIKL